MNGAVFLCYNFDCEKLIELLNFCFMITRY